MGGRTIEELHDAAEIVGWEFNAAVERWLLLQDPPEAAAAEHSLLEAAGLHLRQVGTFLIGRNRKTDVQPSDFTGAGAPWVPPAGVAEAWAVEMHTLDKHLAHITWARVDETGTWDLTPCLVLVARTYCRFVDHLEAIGSPQHGRFHIAWQVAVLRERRTVPAGATLVLEEAWRTR